MGNVKTTVNDASVEDFINSVPDNAKKQDGFRLFGLFSKITGEKPRMWGPSIIGFGQYHYKSENGRREGDWLLTGFSPRKQNLTLYIMHGLEDHQNLLNKLGKHKTGVGCLYINKLADVNMTILEKLLKESFTAIKQMHR